MEPHLQEFATEVVKWPEQILNYVRANVRDLSYITQDWLLGIHTCLPQRLWHFWVLGSEVLVLTTK